MKKIVLFVCLLIPVLFFLACSLSNKNNTTASTVNQPVPVVEQVGAAVLPDTIAAVTAPFAMPVFAKPQFPNLTISITEKGARPGKMATRFIQAAIDAVNAQGGGRVVVPAGSWLTGRVSLKSNVNFYLEEGAELHFSGELEDYRPAVFTRSEGVELYSLGALIYANGQQNIAITGKGKLVGPPDGSVRRQIMTHEVIEKVVLASTPVAQRVYEGFNGAFIFPPMFISPINCKNVYIEGVSLENTAFWNIVPVYCDGVIIRGVTVNSVGIPRGDGIDVESSRNVLIEYCTLSCGDDCFTIKAGRGEDGVRVNKPTENVVVRYCLARRGHGGITCGSETAAMIRNLYVHDCVFDDTGIGIRFKTRRTRAGGGENLTYERIRMKLRDDAFAFDMLGSATHMGELAARTPLRSVDAFTPAFRNIVARNIIVEQAKMFVDIDGIPESPATNVLIENAEVNSTELFAAADATGITIRNARLNTPDTLISLLDARNILFEQVQFNTANKKLVLQKEGGLTDNIRFINCQPAKPEGWKSTSWKK